MKILQVAAELLGLGRWDDDAERGGYFCNKRGNQSQRSLPNRWRRRVNIAARRATIYQAHYVLVNTYVRDDLAFI